MRDAIRKFSESAELRASLLNRIRTHRYFQWSLLGLVILIVASIHIWQRVTILDLVHEVSLLRQEHAQLVDDSKKMTSEITLLSSASRIRRYAEDTLGLVTVAPENMYTLVRTEYEPEEADDVSRLLTALRRATTYMPAVSITQASASTLPQILADSLTRMEGE